MEKNNKQADNNPSLKENIEIIKVIKDNLIEIKTNMYARDNTDIDLELLYKYIKDKEIIGLGEATHGTKEFQNMRTRIISYLIKKLGFRIIVLEESYIHCLRINAYILNGEGTAEEAVREGLCFPWVFKTKETVLLVKMLREYNTGADEDNKVRFYGMDIAGAKNVLEPVEGYLKKVDLDLFNDKTRSNVLEKDPYFVEELFIKNKIQYIERSTEKEYYQVYRCFEVYNQWLEYRKDMTFNVRDKFMFENAKWIIENTKEYITEKVIIIGHNDHIQKGKNINPIEDKQLGYWLKDKYKDKYYNIGFEFSRGTFNSMDINTRELKVYQVDKSISHDLAVRLFEQTTIPMFYLDLAFASRESFNFKRFVSTINRYYAIGAIYDDKIDDFGIDQMIIEDMYNGIIYIKDSSSTTICEKHNGTYPI